MCFFYMVTNEENDLNFNFINVINDNSTYDLLFPSKEIGLAIIELYEKIEDGSFHEGKFVEKDLHEAFAKVYLIKERYPKEIYSGYITRLQEYFLDYNQETQKYFFKDYAYKFCRHAKDTLKGAFNPTRIAKICNHLTKSLNTINSDEDLRFWLKEQFSKFEPDLREQVDFLDRQIILSVEQLKKESNLSAKGFVEVLTAVNENLANAQNHVKELRSAYSETKMIQTILEQKESSDNEINELIPEVYLFIKYINERLYSIDKKLDRIQPKIRQLFTTLNKPQFSSKIEKFIRYLLDSSTTPYLDSKKMLLLPKGIPLVQIYIKTPDFTVIDKDRELFPAKSKQRKTYIQNEKVIKVNTEKILKRIDEQDTIKKWEELIMSEINLRYSIDLTNTFFEILKETQESQIAVSVIFNIIKTVRRDDTLQLHTVKEKQEDSDAKNIALWKMKIIKQP